MSSRSSFLLGNVRLDVPDHFLTPKLTTALTEKRYEGQEAAALHAHLDFGDRVLELGTGLGYLAIQAARIVGPRAVYTVEANPDLIPVITDNLQANSVGGVTVLNGAVMEVPPADGLCRFFLTSAFWASSLHKGANPRAREVTVPALGLKALLEQSKATVLVADVEGAEKDFFQNPLPDDLRLIILELHPKRCGSDGVRQIFDRLSAQGFGYCPRGSRGQIVCFQKV